MRQRRTPAMDAAAVCGNLGTVAAGATAGAVLAGPAAPVGAVVGGLLGALTTAESHDIRTSVELVGDLLQGRTKTSRPQSSVEGEPVSHTTMVAEASLYELQQRTGLSIEEARFYLDEADGDAKQAIEGYEADEAALRDAITVDPTIATRMPSLQSHHANVAEAVPAAVAQQGCYLS